MHNTAHLSLSVLHKQWMCLGMQRHTHITGQVKEFPDVRGEYKNYGNPYLQGTIYTL